MTIATTTRTYIRMTASTEAITTTTTTTIAATTVTATPAEVVSPIVETATNPFQLPTTFDTYGKCTTDALHKSVVDNKFLHSNIIIQSSDTFAFDHQIKSQTHITLLNLTATQVIVHDQYASADVNEINFNEKINHHELVNIASGRPHQHQPQAQPPFGATIHNNHNISCNQYNRSDSSSNSGLQSSKCDIVATTTTSAAAEAETRTAIESASSLSSIDECIRDHEINSSESVCVTTMKDPTMVQHHHSGSGGVGSVGGSGTGNNSSSNHGSTSANSVVRKASPDNNNNNQQHTFSHIHNIYTTLSADLGHHSAELSHHSTDYNSDAPSMRGSGLIYTYIPHNAAISVATSGSPSAHQQNNVSSSHVVTTASTIDEVIADTLKDEHNGNSVSVNGGNNSANSNEDETAHYLSLTSASELPAR